MNLSWPFFSDLCCPLILQVPKATNLLHFFSRLHLWEIILLFKLQQEAVLRFVNAGRHVMELNTCSFVIHPSFLFYFLISHYPIMSLICSLFINTITKMVLLHCNILSFSLESLSLFCRSSPIFTH